MNATVQTLPNKMVVELRKVKYSASLSEETAAFTADLYFDGKKVGTASNHGTGGPNDNYFTNPADAKRFAAFIAAEPPEPFEGVPGGLLKMTEDLFIGNLIEDFLEAKEQLKNNRRFEKKSRRGLRKSTRSMVGVPKAS